MVKGKEGEERTKGWAGGRGGVGVRTSTSTLFLYNVSDAAGSHVISDLHHKPISL